MQSLRELWLEQAYKLPTEGSRRVLVDLGANIGLSSLWLKRHYNCEKIVAIEPVRSNARLVRKNFDANAIRGTVIEAAVGPSDGVVKFEESAASNLGHIGANGYDVRMLCMTSLLRDLLPDEHVDLLKIDIEGGEEALFRTESLRDWIAFSGFSGRFMTWFGYESWFGRVILHAILYAIAGRPVKPKPDAKPAV
jgi:FkbM family methyltransferase